MCEPVFTASYIITNFNSYYDLNVHPGEEIWLSCDCLLSLGWLLLMLLSKCLTFFWYSFTLVKETPPSVTLDEWHCSLRRWIYISGLCCVTMQSFMFDRKGSRTLALLFAAHSALETWDGFHVLCSIQVGFKRIPAHACVASWPLSALGRPQRGHLSYMNCNCMSSNCKAS